MYDPPTTAMMLPPRDAATAPARVGTPVELARVSSALRGARRTFAVVAILGATIGGVSGKKVLHKDYAAATTVVFGSAETPATDAARVVKTVAESVKLPANLGQVRDRLALGETLETMGKSVHVDTTPDSNLVIIRVTRQDPALAARVADALASQLVDSRVSAERERREVEVKRLHDELSRAQTELDVVRGRREKFRAQNAVTDLPSELRLTLDLVARHASDSEAAAATAEAESARTTELKAAAATEAPLTVVAEQHVSQRAARLADIEAQIAAEGGRLDATHPKMLALEAQARSLREELAAGKGDAITSRTVARNPRWDSLQQGLSHSTSERVAAERRHDTLTQLTVSSRERIDALAALQAPLAVLDGELKLAEERVRDLSTRHALAVERARAPKPDVEVLAPAVVPLRPVSATGRVVAIAVPLVALLLAAIVVLARALWGLRATSASEIAFWSKLPVLATVQGASAEAMRGLAADLGDHVRGWQGTTVIAVLDETERSFAELVASWVQDSALEHDAATALVLDAARRDTVRRVVRGARRVLLVVRAGCHGASRLALARAALGPDVAAAVVVFDLPAARAGDPDRLGNLADFLSTSSDLAPRHGIRIALTGASA